VPFSSERLLEKKVSNFKLSWQAKQFDWLFNKDCAVSLNYPETTKMSMRIICSKSSE